MARLACIAHHAYATHPARFARNRPLPTLFYAGQFLWPKHPRRYFCNGRCGCLGWISSCQIGLRWRNLRRIWLCSIRFCNIHRRLRRINRARRRVQRSHRNRVAGDGIGGVGRLIHLAAAQGTPRQNQRQSQTKPHRAPNTASDARGGRHQFQPEPRRPAPDRPHPMPPPTARDRWRR